jgi:hypothetical protein
VRQFVLIPRKREIPLGYLIRSRSPEPSDVVEFDHVPRRELCRDILPDPDAGDVVVCAGDPRLDTIASVSAGDEAMFIRLCQEYRVIPSWWLTEVSQLADVVYKGKRLINQYTNKPCSP